MEKPSDYANSNSHSTITISNHSAVSSESLSRMTSLLETLGVNQTIPPLSDSKEFHSDFIRSLLKVDHIERRRVSCILSVKPSALNLYDGLHGGVVASVAEMVSIACARTVVGKDKELFLGELRMSYLSSPPPNAELKVDASVLRSGRNLTVIAVEFKVKPSGKLAYTSQAIFYNMPISSL